MRPCGRARERDRRKSRNTEYRTYPPGKSFRLITRYPARLYRSRSQRRITGVMLLRRHAPVLATRAQAEKVQRHMRARGPLGRRDVRRQPLRVRPPGRAEVIVVDLRLNDVEQPLLLWGDRRQPVEDRSHGLTTIGGTRGGSRAGAGGQGGERSSRGRGLSRATCEKDAYRKLLSTTAHGELVV